LFVKKPNGFHCECPAEKGIFGRFCQVRAPRGCQVENVRKMGTRHFASEHLATVHNQVEINYRNCILALLDREIR
jgi:hypothetical protein